MKTHMRSRVAMAVTAGCCLLALPRSGSQEGLSSVRWLAGCWEGQRENRVSTEMWMPPAGGLMIGASRTVVSGVVKQTEFLRLSESGDRLVYTAMPSRQTETSFTSVTVTDSSFTVENLAHDFPQRIIYNRRGTDSLLARIEGPGQNGPRGVDYPMRRVECTAP